MKVGQTYAPEWRNYQDPLTGRQVLQLTGSSAEDYHLYFYNPSVTPDRQCITFTSHRIYTSNIYLVDGDGEQI